MKHHEAAVTMGVPVAVVEQALADVTSWPRFLSGVRSVEPLGHARYVFHLESGRDHRQAVVVVRRDHDDRRVTFRALEGPVFAGQWHLRRVDGEHTEVRLRRQVHPASLIAGLAEMLFPRAGHAENDLRDLERHLLTLPADGEPGSSSRTARQMLPS